MAPTAFEHLHAPKGLHNRYFFFGVAAGEGLSVGQVLILHPVRLNGALRNSSP